MNRLRYFPTILLVLGISAGQPVGPRTVSDLERSARAALLVGDMGAALSELDELARMTPDPATVAAMQGYATAQLQNYRAAQGHYLAALDDTTSPAHQRAGWHYNRAVCLMHLGGLNELRQAITHLEECLLLVEDEALATDARHNLELAKLLWMQARQRATQKPKPNDEPADTPPIAETRPPLPPPNPTVGDGDGTGRPTRPMSVTPAGTPTATTAQRTAGVGKLPVKFQGERLPDWTEAELATYFDQLNARLANDRRTAADLTAAPRRPNVKDW